MNDMFGTSFRGSIKAWVLSHRLSKVMHAAQIVYVDALQTLWVFLFASFGRIGTV
ncbi:putative DNA processing protein [Agrobacterium phage OLIVR4]|nr:putative DNA processing protein [Agrobacterium phage OLIVR4]